MQTPEFAYIYGLVDPRCPDVVWYVGKTNNQFSRLFYYKKDRHKNTSSVYQWVKRTMDEGVTPELRVLETVLFSEWKEREIAAIALYRKKNLLLLNKFDGGNGTGVKGKKTHCDDCGRERVQLYAADTTLRCPVCRKKQRREYETQWNRDNPEYNKAYNSRYYEENKERLLKECREYAAKNYEQVCKNKREYYAKTAID